MGRKQKNKKCRLVYRVFAKQRFPRTFHFLRRIAWHFEPNCGCFALCAGHGATEGICPMEPAVHPKPDSPAHLEPIPVAAPPPRVLISYIHFLGTTKRTQADEFIELKNLGGVAQDLSEWRVSAADPGQEFSFPAGTQLPPGEVVRIYTNRAPLGAGQFSYNSKRALWNDGGDLGQLFNRDGQLVAQYGYGSYETRTVDSIKVANGVEGLEVLFDATYLAEQVASHSKVDFLTALERALRCLIEDPIRGKQIKLLANELCGLELHPQSNSAAERAGVRAHLQRQKLHLLSAPDSTALPEGVTLRKNWIFRLETGMADRHFVVVDRSGTEPAYQCVL